VSAKINPPDCAGFGFVYAAHLKVAIKEDHLMGICPTIFDAQGRRRLGGRGQSTCARCYSLFSKEDAYRYIAVGYANDEIFILHLHREVKSTSI